MSGEVKTIVDRPLKGSAFAELAKRSLNELLGAASASATISNIGEEALKDPSLLKEKLENIFGEGSSVIMEYILKQAK